MWIPTVSGLWREILPYDCEQIAAAGQELFVSIKHHNQVCSGSSAYHIPNLNPNPIIPSHHSPYHTPSHHTLSSHLIPCVLCVQDNDDDRDGDKYHSDRRVGGGRDETKRDETDHSVEENKEETKEEKNEEKKEHHDHQKSESHKDKSLDHEKNKDQDKDKKKSFRSKYADLWVKDDDLVELLLLAGVSATTTSVSRAIKALRPMLPGAPICRF